MLVAKFNDVDGRVLLVVDPIADEIIELGVPVLDMVVGRIEELIIKVDGIAVVKKIELTALVLDEINTDVPEETMEVSATVEIVLVDKGEEVVSTTLLVIRVEMEVSVVDVDNRTGVLLMKLEVVGKSVDINIAVVDTITAED